MYLSEIVDYVAPIAVKILWWLLVLIVLVIVLCYVEVYALGTDYLASVRGYVNAVYPIYPEGYSNVFKPEGMDNVFKEGMSTNNMYREADLAKSAY